MSPLEFIPYVIALAIACAIPGPGIAACVGKALGAGFRPALSLVTGIVLGDLIYLTLAVAGLSALAHTFSGVFVLIKFAGAAYLLFLAWNFWRAGIDPEKIRTRTSDKFWPSFLAGFSVTMGNPKTIVFYMALLPTVVDLQTVSLMNWAELAVLTVIVLYAVCIPYIALAAQAREFLSNPRALKWINRGAATAMTGAAAYIVFRE
jgi:threonine/homoserine/homoserine lactone efflux protein